MALDPLTVFPEALATRDQANAAADVADAKQAVADGNTARASQLSAIQAAAGRRPTGGGQFGVLGSRRGGVLRLGGPFGGLASANRKALLATTKAANETTRKAQSRLAAMEGYGLTSSEADAAMSTQGLKDKLGSSTRLRKIDDAGNLRVSYL